MEDHDTKDTRMLTVRLPRKAYRMLRRIAGDRELKNGEVVVWALEVLERYVAGGGAR